MIRLSYLQSEMSLIWRRVGSHFIPAPPEQISLMFLSLQRRTTSAFASRLSMQSTTQLAPSTKSSDAFWTVTQASTIQICTWGRTSFIYFLRHSTLEVPTSLRTAQLCLFRLLRLTLSKSTILMRLTPERASILTTCDPTPPTPNTRTYEFSNLANFYSPKYLMTLANCSFFMLRQSSLSKSCFAGGRALGLLLAWSKKQAVAQAAPASRQAKWDLSIYYILFLLSTFRVSNIF